MGLCRVVAGEGGLEDGVWEGVGQQVEVLLRLVGLRRVLVRVRLVRQHRRRNRQRVGDEAELVRRDGASKYGSRKT